MIEFSRRAGGPARRATRRPGRRPGHETQERGSGLKEKERFRRLQNCFRPSNSVGACAREPTVTENLYTGPARAGTVAITQP
eukprot:760341-Hanusia_phi.AAC.7